MDKPIGQIIIISVNFVCIVISAICIYGAFNLGGVKVSFIGILLFLIGIRFFVYSTKDVHKL